MPNQPSRSDVPNNESLEFLASLKPAVTDVPACGTRSSSVQSTPRRNVNFGARSRLVVGLTAMAIGIGLPTSYYAVSYGPTRGTYVGKLQEIRKRLAEFDHENPADVFIPLAEKSFEVGDIDKAKLFSAFLSSSLQKRDALQHKLEAEITSKHLANAQRQNLILRNIFLPCTIVTLVGAVIVSLAIAKPQRLRGAALVGIVSGAATGIAGAICFMRVWEYYSSYAADYPSSNFSSPIPVLAVALPVGMVLGGMLGLFLAPSDRR